MFGKMKEIEALEAVMTENKVYMSTAWILKSCSNTYGEFFDIDDSDMSLICMYENEMVKYKGKRYIVKSKQIIVSEEEQKAHKQHIFIGKKELKFI